MIKSKEDYKFYLEADKIALEIPHKRRAFSPDEIWRYQRLLRKVEYFINCKKKSTIWRPYTFYLKLRLRRLGIKLGFLIPPNVFGPGLSIAHFGTLIVNPKVRVGENCRIHNCVHIATQCHAKGEPDRCPTIGNNVFIGPGSVIVGEITIADNIVIGANSFVNSSFLEPGITIAGAPAKKVSDKGFDRCFHKATEVLRKELSNSQNLSSTVK
jgi:serine O-acetyltransferase